MRIFKYILLLTFIVSISCKEEKPKRTITKKTEVVQHYICKNKCENSGGETAGNCPTCNTPYTHNVAFHNNDLLKSGPIKIESNATQPGSTINRSNNTPSPAQNAKGVYHYTCKNGCSGGAGSALACVSCGETLEHNTAYH